MKTFLSFLSFNVFFALGVMAQFPNLLVTQGDTTFLLTVISNPSPYQSMSIAAYSLTDVTALGYRDENLAEEVTPEFTVLSSGDTIFSFATSITAVHESVGAVLVTTSDGFLTVYEKPLLNVVSSEQFPSVIQGIYLGFSGTDSIMALTTIEGDIGMTQINGDTVVFIQGVHPESVWFTDLDVESLLPMVNLATDNPFDIDTFVYSDPWFVHVTGEILEDQYTVFDSKEYLFSMDGSNGFQSNFFDDLPGYPRMLVSNEYLDVASRIGCATHADLTIENTMGTAYLFSLNQNNGLVELQSVARSLDDNLSSPNGGGYEISTFGFLDNGTLYRTRMFDGMQILDPLTMEPLGDGFHYGTRQAETTGPNEEWIVSDERLDAYSTEGDLYQMTAPSVIDNTGAVIISTVLALENFVFDGPNCAIEPEQNFPPYTDITHQNGSDAASLDASWEKIFLVNSNRNPRVDSIVNGEVVPISFGLSFFTYDRSTEAGYFLEDFSRDINYLVEPRGQHHPKFIHSEFQDSVIHMTFWNNNHDNCNDLFGEAVTLKIRWLGGNEFALEDFKKLPIGSSVGLGSTYMRQIDGEFIGLANTGGDASWSGNFNNRHAALYTTHDYMPAEIFGVIQLPEVSLNTYHMDFHDVEFLPNIATDISWSLSSDSVSVTLVVESTPGGLWYWNGSDVPTDSALTFPVNYILEKESAWMYISGNFPLDTMQDDWLNRVLSVDPLNLKEELSSYLGIGVGVEEASREDESIILYPNPSNGRFTVSRTNGRPLGQVSVVDMTGREIYRTISQESSVFIDLDQNLSVAKTVVTPGGVVVLVQ